MLRFPATVAHRRSMAAVSLGLSSTRCGVSSHFAVPRASSLVPSSAVAPVSPCAATVVSRRLVTAKAAPTGPPSAERQKTPMEKLKAELWKALKMNLILLPLVAIFVLWMFPVVSPEEERRMLETYRKTAGWKT